MVFQWEGQPRHLKEKHVWRTQKASSRQDVFLTNSTAITLNLFEDAIFQAERDKVEIRSSNQMSWIGKVKGDPLSEVHFVLSKGRITGRVFTKRRLFSISSPEPFRHIINEKIHRDLVGKNCILPSDNDQQEQEPESTNSKRRKGEQLEGDDGSIIDIMILYTPQAQAASGDMDSEAQLAVDIANTGLGNSNASFRFRLAYSGEISYTETQSGTDLTRLYGKTDGYMDEVHALRETHGGDIVSLFVSDISGACGFAREQTASPSKARAFNIVNRNCLDEPTFAHEVGHNLGAAHEYDIDASNGAYSYSHGYYLTGTIGPGYYIGFYTIMAYGNNCVSCYGITYFSNPKVTFPGFSFGTSAKGPVGDAATADSIRTFENLAYATANFTRSKIISHPDIEEDALFNDKCFIATATYGSPFHPYVRVLREFRDKNLLPYKWGQEIVRFYYKHSPSYAQLIAQSSTLKGLSQLVLTLIVFTITFSKTTLMLLVGLFVILIGLRRISWRTLRLPFLMVISMLHLTVFNSEGQAQVVTPSLDSNLKVENPSLVILKNLVGVSVGYTRGEGDETKPSEDGEEIEQDHSDYSVVGNLKYRKIGLEASYEQTKLERKKVKFTNEYSGTVITIHSGYELGKNSIIGLMGQRDEYALGSAKITEMRMRGSYSREILKDLYALGAVGYVMNETPYAVDNQWLERTIGLSYWPGSFFHFEIAWYHTPLARKKAQGETDANHHPETDHYRIIGEVSWKRVVFHTQYLMENEYAVTDNDFDFRANNFIFGLGFLDIFKKANLSLYYTDRVEEEDTTKVATKIYELKFGVSL
ncbi:MAG: CFI-box-CTERM domain-containing protein [Bdellovibrionales bacterium]